MNRAGGLRAGEGPHRLFARFRAIIICAFLGLFVVALALVAASVRVKESQDRRMLTELMRGHAFLLDSQVLAFHQAAAAIGERIRDRLSGVPVSAFAGQASDCAGDQRAARGRRDNDQPPGGRPSGGIRVAASSPGFLQAGASGDGRDPLREALSAATFTRQELEALAPNLAAMTIYSTDGETLFSHGRPPSPGRIADGAGADCARDISAPVWTAAPGAHAGVPAGDCDADPGLLRLLSPIRFDSRRAVNLALDLEPCAISRMNADLPIDGGQVFLVSDDNLVIGSPESPGAITALEAADGLDDDTRRVAAEAFARLAGDLAPLGDRLIFVQPLTHAPWALVVSLSAGDLRRTAIFETSTRLGVLLALIAATLAVAVALTRREFIAPSQALVADIVARGAGIRPPQFAAPAGWRPYFDKIRDVFVENEAAAALRQELTIAARMQASILPTNFPDATADLGVWGFARPAREVGGDFFDFFKLKDGKLGVVIADVSGKGVPAALFMVLTRTLTRAAASEGAAPAAVVARVNSLLAADNPETMFVTMFYGVVDPVVGRMTYVNAGHNAPYLLRQGGGLKAIATACGPALGVFDDATFSEARVDLAPGDTLLLYTDGVTEAMDPGQAEYGEERLEELLGAAPAREPEALAAAVAADVDAFAGEAPQADDNTVLAVAFRRAPSLAARLRGVEEIAPFADRLATWGAAQDASPEDVHAISLSLDELVSNTFEHGSSDATAAPTVDIAVTAQDGALVATLEDDGVAFDPFSATTPNLVAPAEERSIGGLGVHFARTLTDAQTYARRRGRNLVTLTKHLTKREAT